MSEFNSYRSPFSWRYGTSEMRFIWSEVNKRKLWRRIWVHLAQVEMEIGLVKPDQVLDLEKHMDEIDIERAFQIESEINHDLMAELKTYAEQCPIGGGIIHLGATSMDIEDNADALRLRQGIELLNQKLGKLLICFAEKINNWANIPLIGITHLQPAEPTTLGYRFSTYAQDLLGVWKSFDKSIQSIQGKGFKGAVGTAASYIELFGPEQYSYFEKRLSKLLDISFFPVTNQTYPRLQDYQIISSLASLGAVLHKLAFDIRILQSPYIGEIAEPFGQKQVGSSAMPFKRNPIQSEKIDSLSRLLSQMPQTAWHNAANSLLERTLDDSANRRTLLPEAFLICDELLVTANKIMDGLVVNTENIQKNLRTYAPFASTEKLLMALTHAGADRQEMHEHIRIHTLTAWQDIQKGKPNPLADLILNDPKFSIYLANEQIQRTMDINGYTGIAPSRAQEISTLIIETIT